MEPRTDSDEWQCRIFVERLVDKGWDRWAAIKEADALLNRRKALLAVAIFKASKSAAP